MITAADLVALGTASNLNNVSADLVIAVCLNYVLNRIYIWPVVLNAGTLADLSNAGFTVTTVESTSVITW